MSSAVAMPLSDERDLELLLDALDRAPVERGLEGAALHPPPPGGHEALGDVALAPAVMGGVDGQAERRVAVRDGALDVIVDPGLVAAHVELKEAQRIGRRRGQLLEPGIADRAEHVAGAELPDAAHHRGGARGVKAFQRADRRQHHRQAQLAPELVHRRIDLADVAQHPRPERDLVERHAVAPQRGLAFDPADDVVPVVLVQVLPGLGDDLVQIEKVARIGRRVVDGRLLGMRVLA